MAERFDPRFTPVRPDLAAKYLEGKVEADLFVEGIARQVVGPHAPVRRSPAPDASLETEALFGERVTVYDQTDEGWSWGQLAADGYVGWIPTSMLDEVSKPPTHKVGVLRTLVFPGPSIKMPPTAALPMGGRVAVVRRESTFAITDTGGYVPARHLVPLESQEPDFVAVAERFLGTPYLWGGKTSLGLDCSGLVQVALAAAGIPAPRDSDLQEEALGASVDRASLRRGDLVFWRGHVAIARDAATLIHANAYHMAVAIEPVFEAFARIAAAGSDVTSVKRL
jgi:cell wall-associated NlpC family hydrolase